MRFSAFVTSSPSPSSPQPQQQSLTKGLKLSRDENLKQINTSLVQETSSLKRTIKDLRQQLNDLHKDSGEQPKTKQQRLRKDTAS